MLGLYLFDLSNLSANEWLETNFNQYSFSLFLFSLSFYGDFDHFIHVCTTGNLQDELRKGNVSALNVMRLVRETLSDLEGVDVQAQVQTRNHFVMSQTCLKTPGNLE